MRRAERLRLRGRRRLGRRQLLLELPLALRRALQRLRRRARRALPLLDLALELALALGDLREQLAHLLALGRLALLRRADALRRLRRRLEELRVGRLGRRARRGELRGHLAHALDQHLAVGAPLLARRLRGGLHPLEPLARLGERLLEAADLHRLLVQLRRLLAHEPGPLLGVAEQRGLLVLRRDERLLQRVALLLDRRLPLAELLRIRLQHAPVGARARQLLLVQRLLLLQARAQLDDLGVAARDRGGGLAPLLGERRARLRERLLELVRLAPQQPRVQRRRPVRGHRRGVRALAALELRLPPRGGVGDLRAQHLHLGAQAVELRLRRRRHEARAAEEHAVRLARLRLRRRRRHRRGGGAAAAAASRAPTGRRRRRRARRRTAPSRRRRRRRRRARARAPRGRAVGAEAVARLVGLRARACAGLMRWGGGCERRSAERRSFAWREMRSSAASASSCERSVARSAAPPATSAAARDVWSSER